MKLWPRSQRLKTRGTQKYKNTFEAWNKYRFATREAIGYSMKLIKECKPTDPTQWEIYYLKSGQEGVEMKNAIPDIYPEETMKRMIRSINMNHGKNYEELKQLGFRFKEALEKEGIHISAEEAFNYAYIRAIDETWIGYQREFAAEKALQEYCDKNGLTLRPASERDDIIFGVDWEILKDGVLVCGIQVKGSAYKKAVMESGQMRDYDRNLKQQNAAYKERNNVPVFYLFVQRNLQMENMEELQRKVEGRLSKEQKKDENRGVDEPKNGTKSEKEQEDKAKTISENEPEKKTEIIKTPKEKRKDDNYEDRN